MFGTCTFRTGISVFFAAAGFDADRCTGNDSDFTGDLIIHPVQHATFVMSWNNQTIYVDPVGGKDAFSSYDQPDLILITDIHGDHLDIDTLQAIVTDQTNLIAPQAVADKLSGQLKEKPES